MPPLSRHGASDLVVFTGTFAAVDLLFHARASYRLDLEKPCGRVKKALGAA